MYRNLRKLICVGAVAGILYGCVSGSVRRVRLTSELPQELPKELKERFDVVESTHLIREASSKSASSPTTKKGKTKAVVSSLPKSEQAKIKQDSQSLPNTPFVYPTRRPEKEPMWVGEKFVYSISYFGVSAGDVSFETLPFKTLNKRKVYHFRANAVSSAVFSLFYRLNDVVDSYVDYQGVFSHRFHVVLDETKQKRDSLELNDSEKKLTYYWNRWDHKTNGYTETKQFTPIEPLSQDSMSALYYLRTIPLPTGAVITFPLVSEGRTLETVCTVLRREMIDTPMGRVQAIVIRPEIKYQGILKKTGDSFLWLSDDERRIPIRLEAKVKIGTVVGSLKKVELGKAPELNPSLLENKALSKNTNP